ncbi:hypothetical protein H2248_008198 [Termitomyces sp. 'cryptogamus']|nr:hypothetical protein H2248_008198 [Termitomyces sp. 'cryptogamus']
MQNDPTRRSWTARYPSSYDISIFPFKANYPIPTPAPLPPIHINYVKRPRVMVPSLKIVVSDHPIPNDAIAMRSRARTHSLLREDEEAKPVVKKRDPYEEDADVTRLLRTVSRDLENSYSLDGFVKEEPISRVISPLTYRDGSGPSDVIDDFPTSIPVKKEESIDHVLRQSVDPDDGTHRPSKELLAAFADLRAEMFNSSTTNVVDDFLSSIPVKEKLMKHAPRQSVSIKDEPLDSHNVEYRPSEELLAAFADLPAELFNSSRATISPVPMKIETDETTCIRIPSNRERSTTLATDIEETDHSDGAQIRIESEPRDESFPLERTRDPRRDWDNSMTFASDGGDMRSATGKRIKPEPQDDYRIPSLPRTQDPRLIESRIQEKGGVEDSTCTRVQLPVPAATVQVRDPRLVRDRQTTQVPHSVHVKFEPREDPVIPPPPVVRDPRLSSRGQGGHLKREGDNGSNAKEVGRMKFKRIKSEG